jgi:hypothetical protein
MEDIANPHSAVMAGLVPAIHAFPRVPLYVDARVNPGHDDLRVNATNYSDPFPNVLQACTVPC